MNKNKLTILLFIIVLFCGFGLWKLIKNFLLLWNSNHINVTTDKSLSNYKVKIEYGFHSINRKSDKDMFDDRESKTVLYDGENKDKLINEYGENDFLITYNNTYYLSFRQFKFNRRHQHNYNFHLTNENNKVFLTADIIGKDNMKFKREMLEIDKAEKYLYNVPIDSAGTIYNLIKLKNK